MNKWQIGVGRSYERNGFSRKAVRKVLALRHINTMSSDDQFPSAKRGKEKTIVIYAVLKRRDERKRISRARWLPGTEMAWLGSFARTSYQELGSSEIKECYNPENNEPETLES